MIAGYPHFRSLASSLCWDESAIDLNADATSWRGLAAGRRGPVERLVYGFCIGEAAVAEHLDPFAAVTTGDVAACFTAQARDEARHARFFDRVARDVLGVPGESSAQRLEVMRERLTPELVWLFEDELPRVTRDFAAREASLSDAVGLYHMLLEGVVFTLGQFDLLAALDAGAPLPGVRRGVELVLRDERWHVGFGTRCLLDEGGLDRSMADRLRAAAVDAASAWRSPDRKAAARVLDIASRRLMVIELGRRAVPAARLVRSV